MCYLCGTQKTSKHGDAGSMDGTVVRALPPIWPGFDPGVCYWFSSLLREVYLRVLRFFPSSKTNIFQIPIRSGTIHTNAFSKVSDFQKRSKIFSSTLAFSYGFHLSTRKRSKTMKRTGTWDCARPSAILDTGTNGI